MKLVTLAAAVGVAAGVCAALGGIGFPQGAYPPDGCAPGSCLGVSSYYPAVVGSLGILLVVACILGFLGPKVAMYAATAVSAAIAALTLGVYTEMSLFYFWATLVLASIAAVLAFVAARLQTGMSEQSNPMNLPVFG